MAGTPDPHHSRILKPVETRAPNTHNAREPRCLSFAPIDAAGLEPHGAAYEIHLPTMMIWNGFHFSFIYFGMSELWHRNDCDPIEPPVEILWGQTNRYRP